MSDPSRDERIAYATAMADEPYRPDHAEIYRLALKDVLAIAALSSPPVPSEPDGEFYPCKPDIFAATYELASPAAPPTPAPSEPTQIGLGRELNNDQISEVIRRARNERVTAGLSTGTSYPLAVYVVREVESIYRERLRALPRSPAGLSEEEIAARLTDETLRAMLEAAGPRDTDYRVRRQFPAMRAVLLSALRAQRPASPTPQERP